MRALALALLALVAAPVQAAEPISNAKAAEFALHRIERLVILRKIDATHQTQFQRMDLTQLTPQQSTDPAFLIRASQVPGADDTRMSVDLTFDTIGRPLGNTVANGAPSTNPPAWPEKDAVTIAEESLHWLQEQGPVVDELRSFHLGMSALLISPVTDDKGAPVAAEVTIVIARDKPTLFVQMGLDGVFKSYGIVNAPSP